MKIHSLLILFMFYSGLSHAAVAYVEPAENRLFINIEAGHQWTDTEDKNLHGNIYGFSGGIQFNPSWSWDVGYQYHDNLQSPDSQNITSSRLIHTGIRYDGYWLPQDWPESTSTYGRLGLGYWSLDKSVSPIAEVGVSHYFADNISMDLGYQFIYGLEDNNSNSHIIKTGLTYYFGDRVTHYIPSYYFIEENIVGFELESAEITPEINEQLQAIAEKANQKSNSFLVLDIIGYTDSSEANSQVLSKLRAQAVLDALQAYGVDFFMPSEIQVLNGGDDPIIPANTEKGRTNNRRVYIHMRSPPS